MLRDKLFPEHVHIVADEAYAGLSKECHDQILTPYSGLQLMAAKAIDEQNKLDWANRQMEHDTEESVGEYWKMRVFNHDLSSEIITVERVLGMLVCQFGMLWKVIEIDLEKTLTVFQVMCKLHNICIDHYMKDHPKEDDGFRFSKLRSDILPFGSDGVLFENQLIEVGKQPEDKMFIN
jgi:DDE superfamily endonuclease